MADETTTKEPKKKSMGVTVEADGATKGAGISIKATDGEIAPPLTMEKQAEEEAAAEAAEPKKIVGKLPLSPAVIKPPLRFEGMLLSQLTGYPGWMYTEEDLTDICDLIAQCGFEADPKIQVLISLVGLHGAKFAGYMAWRRGTKKDDLRKINKETGEAVKPVVPKGEETAI
jgi:hypothetical protein